MMDSHSRHMQQQHQSVNQQAAFAAAQQHSAQQPTGPSMAQFSTMGHANQGGAFGSSQFTGSHGASSQNPSNMHVLAMSGGSHGIDAPGHDQANGQLKGMSSQHAAMPFLGDGSMAHHFQAHSNPFAMPHAYMMPSSVATSAGAAGGLHGSIGHSYPGYMVGDAASAAAAAAAAFASNPHALSYGAFHPNMMPGFPAMPHYFGAGMAGGMVPVGGATLEKRESESANPNPAKRKRRRVRSKSSSSRGAPGSGRGLTSLQIFDKYVKRGESDQGVKLVDAAGILSRACFEEWVDSRKVRPGNPEEAFRKALISYITVADGASRPFPPEIEKCLLVLLRRKEVWPCFRGRCHEGSSKEILIGSNGIRASGYHERRVAAGTEPAPLALPAILSDDSGYEVGDDLIDGRAFGVDPAAAEEDDASGP